MFFILGEEKKQSSCCECRDLFLLRTTLLAKKVHWQFAVVVVAAANDWRDPDRTQLLILFALFQVYFRRYLESMPCFSSTSTAITVDRKNLNQRQTLFFACNLLSSFFQLWLDSFIRWNYLAQFYFFNDFTTRGRIFAYIEVARHKTRGDPYNHNQALFEYRSENNFIAPKYPSFYHLRTKVCGVCSYIRHLRLKEQTGSPGAQFSNKAKGQRFKRLNAWTYYVVRDSGKERKKVSEWVGKSVPSLVKWSQTKSDRYCLMRCTQARHTVWGWIHTYYIQYIHTYIHCTVHIWDDGNEREQNQTRALPNNSHKHTYIWCASTYIHLR